MHFAVIFSTLAYLTSSLKARNFTVKIFCLPGQKSILCIRQIPAHIEVVNL